MFTQISSDTQYKSMTIRELKSLITEISKTEMTIDRKFIREALGYYSGSYSRLTKSELITVIGYYFSVRDALESYDNFADGFVDYITPQMIQAGKAQSGLDAYRTELPNGSYMGALSDISFQGINDDFAVLVPFFMAPPTSDYAKSQIQQTLSRYEYQHLQHTEALKINQQFGNAKKVARKIYHQKGGILIQAIELIVDSGFSLKKWTVLTVSCGKLNLGCLWQPHRLTLKAFDARYGKQAVKEVFKALKRF